MKNDESVWWMMTAATKRVRVARGMVTAMRAAGNKEGEGSMGHCVGNKGGICQRGQWQQRQEQWGQGCRASDGDVGDGDGKGNNVGDGDGNKAGRQQKGQGRGQGWQGR
jgi:hypothetical protein